MNKAEAKRRAKFAVSVLARSMVDSGWETLRRYTDGSDAEVAQLERAIKEVTDDLAVSGKGPDWRGTPLEAASDD